MNQPSSSPRPPRPPRWKLLAALAGVLLLTVAVYARGLDGDFQFDDFQSVQFNLGIRDLGHFLTKSAALGVLHGGRVLTDFTFAINYWAAGVAPFSFHATNLGIHLAAVLLVFFFARRILALAGVAGRDCLAVAVSAVFALHPLQTQAVIYISQRAESLASALYLGSLLLLLRAERRGFCLAGVVTYLASFALFVLGFSAKAIVVTLPGAYLLIGLVTGPERRELSARTWKRLALSAPFLVFALSTTYSTTTALKGVDAGFAIPLLPPVRYLFTQWHVLVTYLRLLFLPVGQNMDWDFPLARGLGDPSVILSGLFLAALVGCTGILYYRCRSRTDSWGATGRVTVFGLFWFFLLLAPTSSVVPLADVLMEHRTYLASVGIFLASAVLAGSLVERWFRPRWFPAAPFCLCMGLALLSYQRVGLWQSKLALWSDCVAKSPRKARVHHGLGNAYGKEGNIEGAIAEFRTALDLAHDDPLWIRQDIRGKLAATFLMLGRPDDALAYARSGLAEQPKQVNLLGVLAMAYLQQRNLPAAEEAARRSVQAATAPAQSLQILAAVHRAKGDKEGELADLEQAVRLDPYEPHGRLLLARAYDEQGRREEACAILRAPAMERLPQVLEALAKCPGA